MGGGAGLHHRRIAAGVVSRECQRTGRENGSTSILGGGNDGRFAELRPDGALLVGLDIGIGDDVKNDRVWSCPRRVSPG